MGLVGGWVSSWMLLGGKQERKKKKETTGQLPGGVVAVGHNCPVSYICIAIG